MGQGSPHLIMKLKFKDWNLLFQLTDEDVLSHFLWHQFYKSELAYTKSQIKKQRTKRKRMRKLVLRSLAKLRK